MKHQDVKVLFPMLFFICGLFTQALASSSKDYLISSALMSIGMIIYIILYWFYLKELEKGK